MKEVALFEKSDKLLHLQQGSDRYLHPHLYDWPAVGSLDFDARLPILNWAAGTAGEVASQILTQFEEIKSNAKGLNVLTQREVASVDPQGDVGCRLSVVAAPSESAVVYDAVIIAVGYGYEREIVGENKSYWVPSPLIGALQPKSTLFISGNGDGGLVDFTMAAFNRMTHTHITQFITGYPDLESTRKALLDIEKAAWAATEDQFDVFEQYRSLPLPNGLLLNVLDLLRPNCEVWLHTREPKLFRRDTAVLNRFAAFLAIIADERTNRGLIRYRLGSEPTVSPETISIGQERVSPTHRFLRFGAESKKNMEPFKSLANAAPRPPSASSFRPATPKLNKSATQRFGSNSRIEDVRIVVITTLDREYELFLKHFEGSVARTIHVEDTAIDIVENDDIAEPIGLVRLGEAGSLAAGVAAARVLEVFDPGMVVNIGFAAGVDPQTQRLGDLIVADRITAVAIGEKVDSTAKTANVRSSLVVSIEANWHDWPLGETIGGAKRGVSFGTIVSVDKVLAKQEQVQALLSRDRRTVGIDMESYGIAAALFDRETQFLMVRGIADFADGAKADIATKESAMEGAVRLFGEALRRDLLPPRSGTLDKASARAHDYTVKLDRTEVLNGTANTYFQVSTNRALSEFEYRNSIIEKIASKFSLDRLRSLCIAMNVDFERLNGKTRGEKAASLLYHVEHDLGVSARDLDWVATRFRSSD